MATISSRQHALVKEYRRVARGDERLALIDGWHLVAEAVAADVQFHSVAFSPAAAVTAPLEQLLLRIRRQGTVVHEVAPRVLDALSPVRTPSGIVALIERRHSTLDDILSSSPPLVLLAVDMQDPGNVGAIIRSAEAGGSTGVALAGSSADAWSWKALRAAMGSTFRLPVLATQDAWSLTMELKSAGLAVLASVPRGGVAMTGADMRTGTAIIIGGEGRGLDPALIAAADAPVTIPMQSPVESLNAAVAAALLVFEARRQREVRS